MSPSVPPLQALSTALTQLVREVSGSVVAVQSHRARSSGFVWRPGLIVTADEALAEDGEIHVTLSDGRRVTATLAGRDPSTDVAVLRVSEAEQALALPPLTPDIGALSVVVGASDGAPVAALGIVSVSGAGWRSLRGGNIAARIELDVRMQRRAEGGAVLDASGRVFGMAVFGPQRRVLVIPAATIDCVATVLVAHGRIIRGYLGLGLQQVGLADGTTGLMVISVDTKGPAANADIRQGDIVLASDGHRLRSMQDLQTILGPESVGAVVILSISRSGQPLDVQLTVGPRQQN